MAEIVRRIFEVGTYQGDFKWQLHFIDSIRRIVGPFLLIPSPLELDRCEATDFMVLTGRDIRIAARVRRPGYAVKFGKDVTIRSWRDNGARTEWAKIIEDGFADWMFYGHSTGHAYHIYPFFLLNLDVLRELFNCAGTEILYRTNQSNRDGTYFHVIRPGQLIRRYNRPDLLITWEHSLKTEKQLNLFDEAR